MKIMWVGQAGFIVEASGGSLAVDPFYGTAKGNSERLYPPEKCNIKVDMVLSSHAHWDHFDPETYSDYVIPQAIVGPGTVMKELGESGLGIEGIKLDRREVVERCGFKITATMADHDVDSIGFIVETDGYKLYFSGDTLMTTRMLLPNINMRPDIAFICINGKLGNMNAYEAAGYCKALGTKVGVPTHYDLIKHNTEDPGSFTGALSRMAPDVKAVVLKRGDWYTAAELLN